MKKKNEKAISSKDLSNICTSALDEMVTGKKDPKICPVCGSKNTLYRKGDKTSWCRKCGAEWKFEFKKS